MGRTISQKISAATDIKNISKRRTEQRVTIVVQQQPQERLDFAFGEVDGGGHAASLLESEHCCTDPDRTRSREWTSVLIIMLLLHS